MSKKKQAKPSRQNLPLEGKVSFRVEGISDLDPLERTRKREYAQWKKEGKLRGRVYDVWYSFPRDPRACVADADARSILRRLEHPLRPWFPYPGREEIDAAQTAADKREVEEQRRAASADQVRRQHIPWWEDLRGELLRVEVPASLADSFADYMSGYVMVQDREPAKSEKQRIELVSSEQGYMLKSLGERSKGRVTPEWRRAKRTAKAWGFPPSPTTHPPQRQSLKTTLSHLMVEALKSDGTSLAKAAETVNSVWGLIGEASDEFDSGSVARAVRRARQRAKPSQ